MEESDLLELQERAQLSDEFKEFTRTRGYALFEQHVLDKLYERAFDTFKRVDPERPAEIIQAQMMGKMIDQIRHEIGKIIGNGDIARETLRAIQMED